jgi:hypothetical protein
MSSIMVHGYNDWIVDEWCRKKGSHNRKIVDRYGNTLIEYDDNEFDTLEECILGIKKINDHLQSNKRHRIRWLINKRIQKRKNTKITYYIAPCPSSLCSISCQDFDNYYIDIYDEEKKNETPTIISWCYHITTEIY